jgi:hypothetical protein
MARTKGTGGRTTAATSSVDNETARAPLSAAMASVSPLRKRRPVVFWFVVTATGAMVLTTFASFFQALS